MEHKVIPLELSKSDAVRVFDLLIYKNVDVFIKKLLVFLSKLDSKFA